MKNLMIYRQRAPVLFYISKRSYHYWILTLIFTLCTINQVPNKTSLSKETYHETLSLRLGYVMHGSRSLLSPYSLPIKGTRSLRPHSVYGNICRLIARKRLYYTVCTRKNVIYSVLFLLKYIGSNLKPTTTYEYITVSIGTEFIF